MIPTSRTRKDKKVSANLRQLEEQIIYAKGDDGQYIAKCSEYYDKVYGTSLGRYTFGSGASKVVCPFHEDIEPSLGIVKDSSGVEVFNCFGCGAKGTIVAMHDRTCTKKGFSGDKVARLELLASSLGIDLKKEVSYSEVTERVSDNVDFSSGISYNITIHRENVRKIRDNRERLGLGGIKRYWNTLTDTMMRGNVGD